MPLQFELCPGRMIGGNHPCFIIAEIGQNHQGDIEIAKKMIKMAKKYAIASVRTHRPAPWSRADTEEIRATDIQRPPKAQEPQENHRRDYRNPPREEQWRVPGKPPSSDSAEAPGNRSDEPTGPAGSRPLPSRSSHGPRDPRPRDTPPQDRGPTEPRVQAPAGSHRE
ncbi:hypothetical protein CRENBAI_000654 [Crenichthys baileyi]|uniref:Sialic acid synthase n=1 Tax=Crenichthys baileyi TaxID=28760 RepID=A0AAV9RBW6_9TELE